MQGAKDRADDVHAPVDVSADEELFSGSTLQIDLPPAAGARRRLEIHVPSLRRSAGIGKRLRQSPLPLGGGRIARHQLQGAAIEESGPVECEHGVSLGRRQCCLPRRAVAIAGSPAVLEERLWIVGASRRQGSHQEAVNAAYLVRRQLCGQRLAHAFVIHLDARGVPLCRRR